MSRVFTFILLLSITGQLLYGQPDSTIQTSDSLQVSSDTINLNVLLNISERLKEVENQRQSDSLKKLELENQIKQLKTTDNIEKETLLNQLRTIKQEEDQRLQKKLAHINSLRKKAEGFPVLGILNDTIIIIYSKFGPLTAQERASNINRKIEQLYDNDFLNPDSILVKDSENSFDVIYGKTILMSISEMDAMWYGLDIRTLSNQIKSSIQTSLINAKNENKISKLLVRVGLVLMVILITGFIIWLIGKGYAKLMNLIMLKKDNWLKNLSYKDYIFLTVEQEIKTIEVFIKLLRWFTYVLLLYITLPIIFSIFPFSRHWADALFQLIWSPFKGVIIAVWNYLPDLFSILVIYLVMRYVIKFVRYIFHEIESEKLKISGFHADWAMPTYSIVKFLLYAFMFVLIFPLLPNSKSDIFKGVSVFIGILFSLGSSSAISNMIAGLVITYMRPFKIGDRIKIADVSGDVVEKSLLVTRIKTIKNEIITIPNSSVLTGNTTNYTSIAAKSGLIVNSTVTIGYDIPWRNMHEALIEAALRTDMILKEPKPYVLQTALDDFYVSYQINAYTNEASKQALIYSNLHQNIQDVCNEKGIEILSPHYRAARDGNTTTIPPEYRSENYQPEGFVVNIEKKDQKK
ncbi:mechanosensitive ion channel family protein [Carboxylicivirga linearis]|uniref:Mechanosensitive ion channel n=1 Tax=Carboxylicivirga linearis TaxID=1628157 RepID=A0ABS5JT29_9BACT|nr:mechanosensitive ion channel domain-containing protein [Carboxylicivirga linearis]MBS2098017.1 mechanosensitive ion channel [Carboxylicivirga linearis]